MEALLIDDWLADANDTIYVLDDASLSHVRERVREVAAAQGLSRDDAERLATATTELGRNQLRHAVGGRIAVRAVTRSGVGGVEVIAADRGSGIADPARALAGVPRSHGSLGVGLASVRELTHEIDIDVRLDEGTCLAIRRFAVEPTRRSEVGIFGRPIAGETRNGDHAAFVRHDDTLVAAVCDGLGHGPPARVASTAAIGIFREHAASPPSEILGQCHRALGPTRGAVMAIARTRLGEIETASVGNVTVEVVGPREAKRFGGSSFVLGSPQPGHRIHLDRASTQGRDLLLMFTDGITSRASIKDDPALLWQHPVVIAQHVEEKYGKESDDILVLVAR